MKIAPSQLTGLCTKDCYQGKRHSHNPKLDVGLNFTCRECCRHELMFEAQVYEELQDHSLVCTNIYKCKCGSIDKIRIHRPFLIL